MSLCICDYSPARYSISGLRYSCPRKYQLQHWQIALTIRRTHPVDGRAGYNHRASSKKMIRAPRVTARLRLMGFPREIRSSLAFDQFQGQSIVFLIALHRHRISILRCLFSRGRRCVNTRPSTLITTIMISRLRKCRRELRGIVFCNFARIENPTLLSESHGFFCLRRTR